ncbi:hypothetical protein J3P96_07685 [Pseudomonas sp. R3-56]|uniref:hypothetical protein n=1 Tax=Pseudomonas sp. R3-56 TaxID=2817401 RepID=UPI003DA99255
MAAERKTLSEYLKWAELKPRTNDWDALVAYDRDKCNQLLLQEYIEKHHSKSVMPPINEAYGTSESTWRWKLDYVTDTPRLSFHNNPDNTGEVMMSMAILGGKDITLDDTQGFAQITRISSYDPLDNPKLEADRVQLKDVPGDLNSAGKVQLDPGDPVSQHYIWEETSDRIAYQRKKAGAFFKRKFREAPEEKRQFHLGILAKASQEIIKPASIKLRTVMEAGGNLREAANFGNGALEVRIAMEGSLQGATPGEDWLYPLPSDRPDLNAMMLISSEFLLLEVLMKSIYNTMGFEGDTFKVYKNELGFTERVEIERNNHTLFAGAEFSAPIGGQETRFTFSGLSLYEERSNFYVFFWNGMNPPRLTVSMGQHSRSSRLSFSYDGVNYSEAVGFNANAFVDFIVNPETQQLEIKFDVVVGAHYPSQDYPEAVLEFFQSRHLRDMFFGMARSVVDKWKEAKPIDIFLLNTLIFNSSDAVQLSEAHRTGDLALFGAISPRLTTFAIDPMEIMLGYDQTRQFSVNPTPEGSIDWSVEDLEGNTLGVGSINSQGLYTAPGLTDIDGTYMRVKVTASIGGGHTSRALVSVLARTITLNPLIEICNASSSVAPETRELSAHTMNGTLAWRVDGSGSIPSSADSEGKNVYTAPLAPAAPPIESFAIDEVVVRNTATNQEQRTLMVVKYRAQPLVIEADFEGGTGNQAKLVVKLNGQVLTGPLEWKCIPADAGKVDAATGIFTASESTTSQFVLITVILDFMGIKFDGFTILPLPLSPLRPKPPIEPDQFPGLETLNGLLDAVSEELKAINPSANASEEIKGCLQRIATLAEDNRNGQ